MHKRKFIVFLLVFVFVFGVFLTGSFSQQMDAANRLQFSSTQGVIKFFDAQTGKIYKYSETDGSLIEVWTLERLGESLKAESMAKSVFEY
ncbi:MAG: hypothetical protein JW869_01385 [Candidatus Omnitrophica bacterium]|nr:hypothetical protein [Candidatus Omnitrophota bacterium]